MSEGSGDTANLTFAALTHLNPNPGHILVTGQNFDIDGFGWPVIKHHTSPPNVEYIVGNEANKPDLIRFGVFVAGMRELLCQFAIVREDYQPLAIRVETSDRVQITLDSHQVAHRTPFLLVLSADRGDDPHWLV
jgi:hypothetical protein